MNKIQLIAADLDDSLLRRDKTISDYSLDIIKKSREEGIKFAFATGRSELASARFFKIILPDAAIYDGGAIVYKGTETVYKRAIPAEITDEILMTLAERTDIDELTVCGEDISYSNRPDTVRNSIWRVDYMYFIENDFKKPLGLEALKISIHTGNQDLAAQMAEKFPICSHLHYVGGDWYRLGHHEATKENALAVLCENMGIDIKNVAAFGDDYIDLNMLKNCGMGVAMANAVDDVKAAAKYLCGDCDDDGIAKWLEEKIN